MYTALAALTCLAQLAVGAPSWGKSTTTTSHKTSTTSSYPEATYCAKGQTLNRYSLDINFDNITTIPATADNTIPTPYNFLYFEAYTAINTVSTGLLPGIIPHSKPNFAGTGVVNEVLFGNPAISTIYSGSIAKAFDFNSFYFSCSQNTPEGATTLPADCIITVTGYQGSDNSLTGATQICSAEFTFAPSTLTGVVQQAFTGQIKGCQNIQFAIFTISGTGNTIGESSLLTMQFDDLSANVYTCS